MKHHIEAMWARGSRWRKGEGLVTSVSCIGAWEMGLSFRHSKKQDTMFCEWVWCKKISSRIQLSETTLLFLCRKWDHKRESWSCVRREYMPFWCGNLLPCLQSLYQAWNHHKMLISKVCWVCGHLCRQENKFPMGFSLPYLCSLPQISTVLRHPRILMNQYFKRTSQRWYMSIHFLAIEKKKKTELFSPFNTWPERTVPAAAAKSLQSCLTLCDPIDWATSLSSSPQSV